MNSKVKIETSDKISIGRRNLSQQRSNLKLEALHRWKAGQKIVQISKDLQISRETIYRWVKRSEVNLAKQAPRRRMTVDEATRMRIIELWILMKRPKLTKLSSALKMHFGINVPSFRLRRYLMKWNLLDYRPSPFFEVILIEQGWRRVTSDTLADDVSCEESAPESAGHCEVPTPSGP